MKRTLLLLVSLMGAAFTASARDHEARVHETQSILERYDAFRPHARDLAMYRLDWAASLEEARARAAREKRPVLLVIIHAQYGDLFSGHC